MKKFLIAALLTAPAIALFGCQQDASVQGDIASLKSQVASLETENERMRAALDARPVSESGEPEDLGALLTRLERQERELADANDRLAKLEKTPVVVKAASPDAADSEGEGDEVVADFSDADFEKFKAMQEKERALRDAERQKQREAQMAEIAKIAEDNGLEFDPKDPRGSMMKIWSDPEKRAKAMEVMRSEMTKRRLEPLNLDEYQTKEVLRIEEGTRNKISEAMTNARENGATQEEMQAEIKQIQADQEAELGQILSTEQMEQYKESGAGMGGMIPGMGGGMIPCMGGMIPGFGGGGR